MARSSVPVLPLLLLQLLPLLALLVSAGDRTCDLDTWLDDTGLSIDKLDIPKAARSRVLEAEQADGKLPCATLRRIHREAEIDLPFRQRKYVIRDMNERRKRKRRSHDDRDEKRNGEGDEREQDSESHNDSSNSRADYDIKEHAGNKESKQEIRDDNGNKEGVGGKVNSSSDLKLNSSSNGILADMKLDKKPENQNEISNRGINQIKDDQGNQETTNKTEKTASSPPIKIDSEQDPRSKNNTTFDHKISAASRNNGSFKGRWTCYFSRNISRTASLRIDQFCRTFLQDYLPYATAKKLTITEICKVSSDSMSPASALIEQRQSYLQNFCATFMPTVTKSENNMHPKQPDAKTLVANASSARTAETQESSPITPDAAVNQSSHKTDANRTKSPDSNQNLINSCEQSRTHQPATLRLCSLLPMSKQVYGDRLQFSSSGLLREAAAASEPKAPNAAAEGDQEPPTRARQTARPQPSTPNSRSVSAEQQDESELQHLQQLANAKFMKRLLHMMDSGRRRQAAQQLQKLQRKLRLLSRSVSSLTRQRKQQAAFGQRLHQLHAAVAGLQLQSVQKLQGCELKANSLYSRLSKADALLRSLQLQQRRMRARMLQMERQLTIARDQIAASKVAESIDQKNNEYHNAVHIDCAEIYAKNKSASNGVFTVHPSQTMSLPVKCDMTSGGWTVVLARLDGSVDFYRNWTDYRRGFGDPTGEYFIGLDALSQMTRASSNYQLWIELTDWSGVVKNVFYGKFCVLDERFQFQLLIGNFKGDEEVGDSLSSHANSSFSTYDKDNDLVENKFGGSCAKRFHAGFWYFSCYRANPTGRYYKGGSIPSKKCDGLVWKSWKGPHYSLKSIVMKIRRME